MKDKERRGLAVPSPATPRIVVSRCLGFEACRYNGEAIQDDFLQLLKPHVEYVQACPEVEIGLGTPRDPVLLVAGKGRDVRLIQPSRGRDLTELMGQFSRSFLDALPEVDGFVLKSASPSCAVRDSKHFSSGENNSSLGKRSGLFAQEVLRRFPDLPIEDESRLRNLHLREHFLVRIFTLARFCRVRRRPSMRGLVRLHGVHKLLLMAYNQTGMQRLERIVANAERLPAAEVVRRYQTFLRQALGRAPRRTSNVNVLMHGLGYVSQHLSLREKARFLDTLGQFAEGRVPLSTPLDILRSWLIRFEVDSLNEQVYFEPFPCELFFSPR